MQRLLWVFHLQGGSKEVVLSFPPERFQPNLKHQPQTNAHTVWHFLGTAQEVAQVKVALLAQASDVKVGVHAPEQNKAQTAERKRRVSEHAVLTPKCPECFFYTPELEKPCALNAWSSTLLGHVFRTSPLKSSEAVQQCPRINWK